MYALLRRILFCLPAELSHQLSLSALDWLAALGLSGLLVPRAAPDPVELMGIRFPNPVGLAAGLDKNADHLQGLGALGFGFIEVGTITPRPQPGNPKPRLFRLPSERAIINRMGFNNKGVDHLLRRLQAYRGDAIIGVNIGKNFDTPVSRALDDYVYCMRRVYQHADYITVNLSSPNTPGLRDLQFGDSLKTLLAGIKREQSVLAASTGRYVPLAVKIAPDLARDDIHGIARTLVELQLDAVIATNTTITRDGVEHLSAAAETGGLSGAPLRSRANEVLTELADCLAGQVPIIGVGGIVEPEHALEKLRAGASLVQLYTGFIYAGPALIRDVREAIMAQG